MKMQSAHGIRYVAAVLLLAAALCSAAGAAEQGPLATDPENAQWNVSAKTNDAVWLGSTPKKPAVLALNKATLLSATIDIESDAKVAVLRTPSGKNVPLVLNKEEGVTTVVFDLSGDRPMIKIGGQESPAMRGPWIAAALDPSDKLYLEIPGATYATVRFGGAKSVAAAPATAPATQAVASSRAGGNRGTALQVSTSAKAIPNAIFHKCGRCGGTGEITVQVPSGTRNEGLLTRRLYRDVKKPCDRCNGSKVDRASDDAIKRLAGNLVKSIASLNLDDKNAQQSLSEAYGVLTETMIGDRKTWLMLNSSGRGIIAQRQIEPKTPVIVQAKFLRSVAGDSDAERSYLAVIGGTGQTVVLRKAVTAEEATEGRFVLLGGQVAEVSQTKAGDRVVILENGFLVAPAIIRDWNWWWNSAD